MDLDFWLSKAALLVARLGNERDLIEVRWLNLPHNAIRVRAVHGRRF